jgi:hypothetical protein
MRVLMCVGVVALAATVTLGARDAAAQRETKPNADAKLVTVVGCLNGGPSSFTLTNAAVSEEKKDERAIGRSGVVTSYDLTARDGVSLAPHVGHRVALTGAITALPAGGGAGAADASSTQTARPGRGRVPTAQLAVTSLKMVSPICLE